MTPLARFLSKVRKQPGGGCWLWTARKDRDGYGWFWLDGRDVRAHRAAWVLFVGPIPEGMQVLHGCDAPSCANPACLRLGTNRDNVAEREAAGHGRVPRRAPRLRKRCALCSTQLGVQAWRTGAEHCRRCWQLAEPEEARRARTRAWSEAGVRARAAKRASARRVGGSSTVGEHSGPNGLGKLSRSAPETRAVLPASSGNAVTASPVTEVSRWR